MAQFDGNQLGIHWRYRGVAPRPKNEFGGVGKFDRPGAARGPRPSGLVFKSRAGIVRGAGPEMSDHLPAANAPLFRLELCESQDNQVPDSKHGTSLNLVRVAGRPNFRHQSYERFYQHVIYDLCLKRVGG